MPGFNRTRCKCDVKDLAKKNRHRLARFHRPLHHANVGGFKKSLYISTNSLNTTATTTNHPHLTLDTFRDSFLSAISIRVVRGNECPTLAVRFLASDGRQAMPLDDHHHDVDLASPLRIESRHPHIGHLELLRYIFNRDLRPR